MDQLLKELIEDKVIVEGTTLNQLNWTVA